MSAATFRFVVKRTSNLRWILHLCIALVIQLLPICRLHTSVVLLVGQQEGHLACKKSRFSSPKCLLSGLTLSNSIKVGSYSKLKAVVVAAAAAAAVEATVFLMKSGPYVGITDIAVERRENTELRLTCIGVGQI